MRALTLSTLAALLLVASPALAQPAPPAPPAAPSPSPGSPVAASRPSLVAASPDQHSDWKARFTAARELLFAGKLAEAAVAFDALALQTSDPIERALSFEMARFARELWSRELRLEPKPVVETGPRRRTTAEIASLYTAGVLYGIGTGGWVAVLTEPRSAGGAILPALGLAGLATAGVWMLDSGKGLGYGVPSSMVTGLEIGLAEGILLTTWNQARVRWYDEWSGKTMATLIWGSATVGAAAGLIVGEAKGTSPGTAQLVSSGALWGGMVSGLTVAALAGKGPTADENALLGAVIGLNAGAVGAALVAGSVAPTVGRVRFVDLGGLAGGLTAGGLYFALADRQVDENAAAGITAAGAATGLGVAWLLTSGMAPDRGEQAKGGPPSWVSNVRTSVSPTQGGLTIGLSGMLF